MKSPNVGFFDFIQESYFNGGKVLYPTEFSVRQEEDLNPTLDFQSVKFVRAKSKRFVKINLMDRNNELLTIEGSYDTVLSILEKLK